MIRPPRPAAGAPRSGWPRRGSGPVEATGNGTSSSEACWKTCGKLPGAVGQPQVDQLGPGRSRARPGDLRERTLLHRQLVDPELVLHRDVGGGRRGARGLEVDDPDPAVGLPLDPVGACRSAGPARRPGRPRRRTAPRCPAARGRRGPPARRRSARAPTRPRPARPRTASWRRSRAGPRPTRGGRRARRVDARRPRPVLGQHVDRPSRSWRRCCGRARPGPSGSGTTAAGRPARGRAGCRTGGPARRAATTGRSALAERSHPPPAFAGRAAGPAAGRRRRRRRPAGPAGRRPAPAGPGGVSGSTLTLPQLTDQRGQRQRAARPAGQLRGPASRARCRNRDGWSPSPSVPATAVTTSRDRARVQAT